MENEETSEFILHFCFLLPSLLQDRKKLLEFQSGYQEIKNE